MSGAFEVVRDFERAIANYTGARYAVTVNSCTNALFLCCKYLNVNEVCIPKRTYVGVPMAIVNAGGRVKFDDREWRGSYGLDPYPIYDSARRFTSGMYRGGYECVSFHIAKILGLDQGGAILHEDEEADKWFRKARFDGRTEGTHPKEDTFSTPGWHFYLSPPIAAQGLWRMSYLPKHNDDLPNDDYPDLSQAPLFK
jgi:dTDP-4-amino-4,6-dideoxygalactose transaminase